MSRLDALHFQLANALHAARYGRELHQEQATLPGDIATMVEEALAAYAEVEREDAADMARQAEWEREEAEFVGPYQQDTWPDEAEFEKFVTHAEDHSPAMLMKQQTDDGLHIYMNEDGHFWTSPTVMWVPTSDNLWGLTGPQWVQP